MSDFQTFIESVQHVPAEFERSINLVKELDTRIFNLIEPIKALEERYRQTRSRKERLKIREELEEFNQKLQSLGFDKSQVAEQTYTLIDNTVNQLVRLANPKNEETDAKPLGLAMPIDPDEPKYCFCRGVSYGDMIACDNKDCPTEWFHIGCVNLRTIPSGKWYCVQCSESVRKVKKSKRRR
uniref:Inhibitor of growth protein n=1 Tax=Aceria tosichella TaxID=561515 RepID=A0A6G1SJN4_9ACAR